MFEKVNQAAEQMATSVSRRGFLGKLGRSALAVAGVLAGLSASSRAHAGQRFRCCYYICDYGTRFRICDNRCARIEGCHIYSSRTVSSCAQC